MIDTNNNNKPRVLGVVFTAASLRLSAYIGNYPLKYESDAAKYAVSAVPKAPLLIMMALLEKVVQFTLVNSSVN